MLDRKQRSRMISPGSCHVHIHSHPLEKPIDELALSKARICFTSWAKKERYTHQAVAIPLAGSHVHVELAQVLLRSGFLR